MQRDDPGWCQKMCHRLQSYIERVLYIDRARTSRFGSFVRRSEIDQMGLAACSAGFAVVFFFVFAFVAALLGEALVSGSMPAWKQPIAVAFDLLLVAMAWAFYNDAKDTWLRVRHRPGAGVMVTLTFAAPFVLTWPH